MCPQIIALVTLCAVAYGGDSGPTFVFADFASGSGLSVVGSAQRAGKVLRLTPATEQIAGAAWAGEKQAVGNGFETTFQFQLTEQGGQGHGADGFAFVLQNSGPSAIAGRGGAGGFALGDGFGNRNSPGIPHSIAVFFDTHQNPGDPSGNYIAVCTNGNIAEMRWPPPRLAYTRKLRVHLKDGKVHTVRIVYKPPILSVFLDQPVAPVLVSTVDLSTVVDAQGRAFVGFTASTGAGFENHDILSWSFSAGLKAEVSSNIAFMKAACLPDRNLCTPDQVVVDETGPGRYHIVLPANLEWGASIPNPSEHAIVVSNARGTICWDLKNRGADGCSGPAVNVVIDGQQADSKPGALISRTKEARTYFSVNDPSGQFDDNEGFVEFDVEVR
jgi:hypothetical protein